jgi:hypothetical protein
MQFVTPQHKKRKTPQVVTTDQLPVNLFADSSTATPEPIKFSKTLNPFLAKHKADILKLSPNF